MNLKTKEEQIDEALEDAKEKLLKNEYCEIVISKKGSRVKGHFSVTDQINYYE